MTVSVDPSARVANSAVLGDGVEIGPYCVVGPEVRLADGVKLLSHAVISGRTHIGEGTIIYPMASIGQPALIHSYRGTPGELVIGARCELREYVTISTGSDKGDGKTEIGNDCMLMQGAHVGHDCKVGHSVTLVAYSTLAGHCVIGNFAIISAHCGLHQFVRIGESAFVGAMTGITDDLIPFGMAFGNRGWLNGLNLVGLKRRGFERENIHALRRAYRLLFANDEGTLRERVDDVAALFPDDPLVQKVIQFIREGGERAILTPGNGRSSRDG